MKDKFRYLRSTQSLLLLLSLSILVGCGSNLTDLDLPSAASPGDDVEAAVSHSWDTPGFSFDGTDESSYIFSAVIPSDWTPEPGGSYEGTLDGLPFSRSVSIISAPPTSNLADVILDPNDVPGGLPEELLPILEQADCLLTPPVVPPGFQLVWYQTDGQLPELDVLSGDGGTLTVNYTAGNDAGSAQVTYQHALYLEGTTTIDDAPELIMFCLWFIAEELSTDESLVPEFITGFVNVVGVLAERVPIPTLGAAALIVLSLLIALTGIVAGRRRRNKS